MKRYHDLREAALLEVLGDVDQMLTRMEALQQKETRRTWSIVLGCLLSFIVGAGVVLMLR